MRQGLLSRLAELRKWDLTPLGAALLVGLIVVVAFGLLVSRAGGKSQEEQIRGYFRSPDGGGAPRDKARLINVPACVRVGEDRGQLGDYYVVKCRIEYRDKTFSTCFDFHGDDLVTRTREADAPEGCDQTVSWSRDADSFVSQ